MAVDRYLISGAVLLLIFEVVWFLNDFKIVRISWLKSTEIHDSCQRVGEVAQIRNRVQRRAHDSILWENSEPLDPLYRLDSVLTLPESSAVLTLHNDTQIFLSENTLIRIEENPEPNDTSVRIVFFKGNLRTLVGGHSIEIRAADFLAKAIAGSEFHLRQIEGERVQLEMLQGQARVISKDSQKFISSGKVLSVGAEKNFEEQVIDPQMQWITPNGFRVYSFSNPALVKIQWQGRVEKLWHLRPNRKAETLDVAANGSSSDFWLEPGEHYFRLERNGRVSNTLQVGVFKAPVIHLLSPLPRDRVEPSEQVGFSWIAVPLAQSYRWQLSDRQDFSNIIFEREVSSTFLKMNLNREGAFYWKVLGIDERGYILPSLYSNPIYNFGDLLQAPVVRPPRSRQPAKESSWLEPVFKIFVSMAQAAELYEVYFEWEPVPEADHYIIEIDENGSFQNPIAAVKTYAPSFLWNQASLGIYYWRVAAGRKDVMGRFSLPQKIDLAQILEDINSSKKANVLVKRILTATSKPLQNLNPTLLPPTKFSDKPLEPLPSQLSEALPKQSSVTEPSHSMAIPATEGFNHFYFYGGVGYETKTLGVPSQTLVSFSSPLTPFVGFHWKHSWGRSGHLWIATEAMTNKWKAKNSVEMPLQKEITESSWRNHFYLQPSPSNWAWGMQLSQLSRLTKAPLTEILNFERTVFAGVSTAIATPNSWGQILHEISVSRAVSGQELLEIWFGNHFKKSMGEWDLLVALNGFYRVGADEPSSWEIFLAPAVGFHW